MYASNSFSLGLATHDFFATSWLVSILSLVTRFLPRSWVVSTCISGSCHLFFATELACKYFWGLSTVFCHRACL